jgi:autotransporter-associated beta strand protein
VTDRILRDDIHILDVNSAYSLITLGSSTNNGGSERLLNIESLDRAAGASVFVRAPALGNAAATNTTTMAFANASSYLKGAGSTSGTNMSIIPWMLANNTNANASAGGSFATYTQDGVRALVDAEYATSILAGADQNVSTATLGVPAAEESVTINALRHPTSGSPNIGAGKTLIVASGGVLFTNVGAIGVSGDPNAGTLQFGTEANPAEGVVWANGTNVNRISASIAGTLGLTKAGTGTLVLNGDNVYSGLTYVGGGTLQVGDGTFASDLGLSLDIRVANGATLWLYNGDAIDDAAVLTLESFGLANGKLQLNSEVNETVGGLFFANAFAPAGTYGATGSGATFINDTYFGGNGVLTVVPEPATTGMLIGALGTMLLARRPRRSSKS